MLAVAKKGDAERKLLCESSGQRLVQWCWDISCISESRRYSRSERRLDMLLQYIVAFMIIGLIGIIISFIRRK